MLVQDLGLCQQRADPAVPLSRYLHPDALVGGHEEAELALSAAEDLVEDPSQLRIGRLWDLIEPGDPETGAEGLLNEVERHIVIVLHR